ncbi:PEBP-like protein [Bimuria novae-zelandiae CBS 107.79]|uniref:PEBP-like protein n=1 Tax=Bimuria novae-zelandiae CBS 107.79 TaxID=1447943 RepID=A0A6A5VAB3_9PLEO|nr:PEBP-like protein [Bimuria novae-zelandiae CBS 107.79]
MWLLRMIEYCLGRLLYHRRGYDADCFFNSVAFKKHPKPTIPLESPDCGSSCAHLRDEYSAFGAGRIPSFTWPKASPKVKEYLFLAEDPDSPLGHANVHALYLGIPPTSTSLLPEDLELVKEEDGVKVIKSGWRVGKNRKGWVYIPARPPRGHGPHRYYFELVALSEKLDLERMSKVPTKEEVAGAIDGKMVEWGRWDATYESRF